MKSKLIMLASIVVGAIAATILGLFFEAIGLSTSGYGYSPNWMDETIEWGKVTTFTGWYSMIFWVLIATRTHWLLSGETPSNSDIKIRTGWWYWLFGSTAWLVIIYLIGLINIRPPIIESLIETVVSLALLVYLYKHYFSKIRKINLQQRLKAKKDTEDNNKDSAQDLIAKITKSIEVPTEGWQKVAMEHLAEETIEANQNSENLKGSKPSWTDQVKKSLNVTPEEWEKVWMEHLAEETIEANKSKEEREKSSISESPFALVEDGTLRAWLFIGDEGEAPLRDFDGNWSNEEVVMPDELGDFRKASKSELLDLLIDAESSLKNNSVLTEAIAKEINKNNKGK